MLLSKDIISNSKLPNIIRNDNAFRFRDTFSKVFEHIGLRNTEQSIKNINPTLFQNFKSSFYGMRLNLSHGHEYSLLQNLGWGILGAPLLFTDNLLDRFYLNRFKQQHKDEDLKVVFSASDTQGAWDIATMSMRGISSCQSWNASRSFQLVGSIIDPCCGIIYLTNGKKTRYGSEMMYRAVVRYVVHDYIGPCLFMEKTYPVVKHSHKIRAVNLLFATWLAQNSKLPILYDYCLINDNSLSHTFIPQSEVVYCNMDSASYRDSDLQYRHLNNYQLNSFPALKDVKTKYLN